MPRWLEILFTLVLFTIGMTVLSWIVHATVPGAVDWLWDRVGPTVTGVILVAGLLAAGAYGWHGYRRATKASGR